MISHPFGIVGRGSDAQLQVSGNLNDLIYYIAFRVKRLNPVLGGLTML